MVVCIFALANFMLRDDAILPVALEDLFPYDIPATDKPVYHEAIDSE